MTDSIDKGDLAALNASFQAVEARIASACTDAGRERSSVRLLPVTKTVAPARLRAAHALGYAWFGENKVQEAQEKAEALAELAIDWCIIGHLQTNKARHVARFAAELHSLDSLRLAAELDRRLQAEGRAMRVLIQVNTSGEASKAGLAPQDVPAFLRELPAFASLQVRGFMTLAMASDDEARVRGCFRLLRSLREAARQDAPAGLAFDELSMGMSGDFPWAIAEGATIVRVGTALFGERHYA
ncbi:YggS family pyridoxal phosphate-dependent enzyme [Verticiella sediminum]|uniref:Pyridoxal phosphate homeostasis protein n=1 Tax=Verticiella sediminum TaxID=1247510 RepID=A0A556AYE1_9BURK|nr:YggS family pyridoxal phosphate-dependent enzyme [Verticiella sediminum]TSH97960.1 YggS family pyridoxal phosphate-dependent enzyme [Verticiella sediminum]